MEDRSDFLARQRVISHRCGWVFNYRLFPVIGISTHCLGDLGDLGVRVWGRGGACSAPNDVE